MKRLSNYIMDLGRAVAYYPNLKKLTGSTTATILLCQLIYWTDKSKDGWIWKTSDELEEETGLTYNEQKTAKKALVDAGLILTEVKRLDHTTRYKVNQNKLNDLWEELTGKESEMVEDYETVPVQPEVKENTIPGILDSVPVKLNSKAAVEKAKADRIRKMKKEIEVKLHVIPDNRKWKSFMEFAYEREVKYNQKLDVFLNWAVETGYTPVYWPPDKMKTMYPQAFIGKSVIKPKEDFVERLPERKEEEYVPMPKSIKTELRSL